MFTPDNLRAFRRRGWKHLIMAALLVLATLLIACIGGKG